MAELGRAPLIVAASLLVAAAAPDAQRQEELLHRLRHDCGACHGMTLRGGLGPPLLPAELAARDVDELARIVLEGVARTPMPPWRGELSEPEARWLVGRLKEGLDHAR